MEYVLLHIAVFLTPYDGIGIARGHQSSSAAFSTLYKGGT